MFKTLVTINFNLKMTKKTGGNFSKNICIICIISCSWMGLAQNGNININVRNEPLSTVIKQIEQQTSFRVMLNSTKINDSQKVSFNISDGTIAQTLDGLFFNMPISYVIKDQQILLTEKIAPQSSATTKQNQRLITGKVLSASDNFPLAGATILIKGKGVGAVTNIDGEFTYLLKGNDIPNIVLEVQYLGMHPLTQRVGNTTEFKFYLEEFADQLNQIVITSSYGTKKLKEEIVGSISTLTSEDIAVEQAAESIDKLVDGQIAGVLIENTTGVGTPVKINIRGQGSLTPLGNTNLGTSTQPLIIVDGVIMGEEIGIDNAFFDGSGSFGENLSNPLAQISPENIESFTVLKDAAAVSIYGADGANGVIIITTKRGTKGKAKFGFSSQLGVSSAINQIEYLSGAQYNELRNEYLSNSSSNFTPTPYNGVNTNWFNLLNGSGIYNKYNFNVSGGTSALTYRTSLSYLKIEEPQLGNNTEQYNANVNLGYRKNNFQINVSLNPSYIKKTAPNIYYSYAFAPTISPYNDDGSFSFVGVTGLGNPLAAIEQNRNISNSYGLVGSIDINYDLTKELKFKTLFGLDFKDKDQDRYFSGENESGRYSGSFILDGETYPNYGRRVINERNSTKWNWQGQVLYDKQLSEHHHLDGLIGFELSKDQADFKYASGSGFVNPNIINNVSDAIRDDNPATTVDESIGNQTFSDDISYNARASLFSQINYNFKRRYYVLANFRRDQSSVFGDDSDVANNGGAGISWILSNENWLGKTNWIDFLKLKVSYGTTGNSRIGSYRSKGLYNISQNGYNGFDKASTSAAPNGGLRWEKNTKFNVGLDFNIFDKFELSLEYYYDNITDLITSRNIPSETGYGAVQLNAASMYNRGFELSSKVKWMENDNLRWFTSFNISTLQSKVTELVGLGSDFSTAQRALAQKVGYSTSTIWGINWAGIDPATGRDLLEKDGKIYDAPTYNGIFNNSDWVPIGDNQPDAYGGFNNTIVFNKQLSLSIRGTFQIGGDFLAEDELISQYRVSTNRNLAVNAYDYWRNQGDVVLQPAVTNNNPVIPNLSKFLYDATYLKISNINLNYSVPVEQISFLDNLSIFVDASNVAYWYKEKSPPNRNGIKEFRFTYPQARTISLGLNAKF